MKPVRVAICIATFRRADGLARALRSVALQQLDASTEIRAIVVNNDPTDTQPDAIADGIARDHGLSVRVLAEPARGVAHARNRALAAARGACDMIAFLDDDEEAPPEWLGALLATKARFGAEAVTGGIVPVFAATPPAWAVDGGFFARPTRSSGSERPWAFTGNVLFDEALLDRLPVWFDSRFTQGEDRHFFARLRETGARIVWCAEAPPAEHVPAERVDPAWLARRMRAIGRAVTTIERDTSRAAFARTRNLAKGMVWIATGTAQRASGFALGRVLAVRGKMHFAYGLGLIEGALGRGVSLERGRE